MNKHFPTLAVVRGGSAREREVSLSSGAAVIQALQAAQYSVLDWAISELSDIIDLVRQAPRPLLVVNLLHGRGGEDGQLQALLDVLGVPYTGSDMMASALAMDKAITKQLWRAQGLPTADYYLVRREDVATFDVHQVTYPVMVKPAREGSSIGMFRVDCAQALPQVLAQALTFDDHVLVESWIEGAEYTVAILGQQVLPMIRLKTPHLFYDYAAKYQDNTTEYLCPCGLSADEEQAMQVLALQAFNTIGARVWGRVDLMIDRQGQPWLLELNTVPGMTDHSLVPMAAHQAGLSFTELVERIIQLSLCAG